VVLFIEFTVLNELIQLVLSEQVVASVHKLSHLILVNELLCTEAVADFLEILYVPKSEHSRVLPLKLAPKGF